MLWILLLLTSPASAQTTESPWGYYYQAKNMTETEPFRALELLNKCIEADPKFINCYQTRGQLYHDQKKWDLAVADLKEVVELSKNPVTKVEFFTYSSVAHRLLAVAYKASGRCSLAIEHYTKMIDLAASSDPTWAALFELNATAENRLGRGVCFNWTKRYDAAINDFKAALKINPKLARAYSGMGVSQIGKGELDQAFSEFDKAVEMDPKLAEAYGGRGLVYERKKDLDKALAEYGRAVQADPNYSQGYAARGQLYDKKGETDKAVADYSKAIELESREHAKSLLSKIHHLRGKAYLKKEDLKNALTDFSKALELNPKDLKSLLERAGIYARQKKTEEAVSDWTKAKELDPDNSDTYDQKISQLKPSQQPATAEQESPSAESESPDSAPEPAAPESEDNP